MNSSTKIWVIPKGLIIGAGAAVFIAIILAVILILTAADNSGNPDNAPASSPDTPASGSRLQADNSDYSKNTSSEDMYVPGVYTASISLDNSPMSIKVTVDANNINSIDLVYTDEAITTMYPMLSSCFNELAKEVCDKGSTKNITYNTDNRYTAAVILKGIEGALEKAEK